MIPLPYVQELIPSPPIELALRALAEWPNLLLLDSSLQRSGLGRYSFLTADPFELFEESNEYGSYPFSRVNEILNSFPATTIPDLPPFQGGAAGVLTYELGHCFERLPVPKWNPFQLPGAVIGVYDWTLAWDHDRGRCWFIGQGFPEEKEMIRLARAETQCREIQAALTRAAGHKSSTSHDDWNSRDAANLFPPEMPLHPLPFLPDLQSRFDHGGYLTAVQRVIDEIYAGEIFQANLSQQLFIPAAINPIEQYISLRKQNPAPFAGFFTHDDWAILSSSPERFVQKQGDIVSTRPIKGTRQRRHIPEADLFSRDELRESEKDRAENVMIVDLLRNDFSRVCLPGSIRVPELCLVEAYETVSHLVSEVRGQLRPGFSFWDLLQATFPGGSITGAPKIRAMEIITEIEQVARGAYCGSLFYSGFDGTADSSILIRTMTQRHGWLSLPAGGGIVAQSHPEEEYQETLHKVRGLLNALARSTDS
ncbi:MAG TPA: anthranilate synthase component I family protein [Planctomicrobium sp.]|nr:anthranilate synthase component I family protein [Planctomicrobium sp.]